jgi:hypothetical protein
MQESDDRIAALAKGRIVLTDFGTAAPPKR